MNDLTTLNIIFLVLSLLISGYFAGLVGMPLGPIRIFFMLFFGVKLIVIPKCDILLMGKNKHIRSQLLI